MEQIKCEARVAAARRIEWRRLLLFCAYICGRCGEWRDGRYVRVRLGIWGGGRSRANVRGAVSSGKKRKLGSEAAWEFFEDGRMRLARRIIPCLDVDGSRVVKGVNFVGLRDAGDPADLAARYNAEGADELVVLDIAASRDRRPTFLETIRRVAQQLAIPLTAGGGIRTLDDSRAVVEAGAEKVTVNTAAVERPELISELSQEFGAQ